MTDCFFFSAEWMDGSSDIQCVVNDRSVVFMQFVRSGGRVVLGDRQIWVVPVQ